MEQMMNFGGIDAENRRFEDARFVVIPVPYDLTSTYQAGSRKGPAAILDASANMELYDEELGVETYLAGIHTVVPLEVDARGPEAMAAVVRREVAGVFSAGKVPVVLGGEHSITIGAVQAAKDAYPSLSVLQLDAHADLRDSYQNASFSHAAVGRRIFEICPLVQVGVRSMSVEEARFIEEKKIITFPPDSIQNHEDPAKKVCENLSKDIYITLDIDVLDPSIMPATGTPEPGGILWNDLIRLIRGVSERCMIRGFDIVELCPISGMVAPDFTAAKLAYRIMGYINRMDS
ncbi:MAG: agmatinase [Deltaproteobacteria bacterium]|nr:agmatinase [Deltaproteobacteria bacterium]